MMKNSEYWKIRFLQLENASHESASDTVDFIDTQYDQAIKEIGSKISTWYARFAKNNGISMSEARQWLSASDLKELKWDIKEYIKYGHENGLSADWSKELENASAKFHISKLEALKLQTQMTVDKLFGKQISATDKLLRNTYLEGYYHSAFEIQHGMNIGWNVAAIDDKQLEKVMKKPWTTDGLNFSDRIWDNRTSLIAETHKQLTQNILLGKSPDAAINAIAKKFNTSKNQAGRLVMTESAYFSSQAQKDCFNELDVEQYEIVATLDSHTSEICRSMDGKVFPMKEYEPGVTAPPFHPWCRTVTVPYFADNYTERAARDADGKTYYVPDDIKYPEWKEKFVDGGDLSGFDVIDADGIIHYTRHKEPEPMKPKKEYLTKKKLQANIADADVQLEKLENQFKSVSNGWTYGEAIKDFGSLENLADGEELKQLQNIHSQAEQIEKQKAEWQEKLNKKLTAEKKKELLKQQAELQKQLDEFEIKTYSNIWKDDVTTLDWSTKQFAVQAKKDYFTGKLINGATVDEMQKWQDLIHQLEDFDTQGKSYFDIQKELNKIQAELTSLKKNGIMIEDTEKFSQERKDAALWAKDTAEADAELRDVSGQVWKAAPQAEKDAIYDYTSSYHKFNEPLRGIEYGTSKYVGVGKIDMNQIGVSYSGYRPGQVKKEIDDMTSIISKSTYKRDVWLQRGCNYTGMDNFFEINMNDLQNFSESELRKALLGKEVTEFGFCSTGVAKGKGFSSSPIILNIYCPSGTQMMYAEPFSAFGRGLGKSWDGVKKQTSFGHESEMILQRGTKFRIIKVERTNSNIYVDMEVIEQVVN